MIRVTMMMSRDNEIFKAYVFRPLETCKLYDICIRYLLNEGKLYNKPSSESSEFASFGFRPDLGETWFRFLH